MTNPPPIQSHTEKHHVSCSLAPNSLTDPPPIQSSLEKHHVSCSSDPNSPTWTINNYKQNTNNDNDATALLTSDDPPTNNNATLSPDNEVLLSTVFPQQSLMVKNFQEYATTEGFLLAEHTKQSFTTEEFANFFPGESNHSLGSNAIQTMTHARRGYLRCSPKSHGCKKGIQCCFLVPFFWNASHNNFMLCSEGSNLSHNHWLLSQLTVIDGRALVNLES
jgi:hypothetical protein